MTKNTALNQVYIKTERPWSGFEPEPRDPQSHVLPSYTTTAIRIAFLKEYHLV